MKNFSLDKKESLYFFLFLLYIMRFNHFDDHIRVVSDLSKDSKLFP